MASALCLRETISEPAEAEWAPNWSERLVAFSTMGRGLVKSRPCWNPSAAVPCVLWVTLQGLCEVFCEAVQRSTAGNKKKKNKNSSLSVMWCNSRFPCFVGSISCGLLTHVGRTRPCGLIQLLLLGSLSHDAGALSVPLGSLFCPELVALKQGGGLIFVMAGQSRWLLLLLQALVATSCSSANSSRSAGADWRVITGLFQDRWIYISCFNSQHWLWSVSDWETAWPCLQSLLFLCFMSEHQTPLQQTTRHEEVMFLFP